MSARRKIGANERAWRAWVRQMGELSPREAATAAQLYTLAGQLDLAQGSGGPLSAVAALSRELRQVAAQLRDARPAVGPAAVEKPADKVDQVARNRQARVRAAQAGEAAPD